MLRLGKMKEIKLNFKIPVGLDLVSHKDIKNLSGRPMHLLSNTEDL